MSSDTSRTHILPNYLDQLTEENIIKMFLDMKENYVPIWKHSSFVQQNFFDKLQGGFVRGLLQESDSIDLNHYPIEALIWAYSRDDQSDKTEATVIGALYDSSRKGKIIPRANLNVGNVKAADDIIDCYFSSLKRNLHRFQLENAVKQKVVYLIESKHGEVNNQILSFLADFYANHIFIHSYIMCGIARATYGLNASLHSSIVKYLKQNNISTQTFEQKDEGAQYGTIVTISNKKRLFVKAHQNYPYSGLGQCLSNNNSSSTINDSASHRTNTIKPVQSVNLKELFAYKVLEYTGFGPKSHFIINENLESGVYIGTEELSHFSTIKNIMLKNIKPYKDKFSKLAKTVLEDNFIANDEGDNMILMELTALDIVARSMLLCDFNQNNIGFLSCEGNDTVKIVDFMLPTTNSIYKMNQSFIGSKAFDEFSSNETLENIQNYPYFYSGIAYSFLIADTFTSYPNFLLQGAFKPKLGIVPNVSIQFKKQKKAFGSLALKKIGGYERLASIFSKAYEEICKLALENRHIFALDRGFIKSQIDEEEDNETILSPLIDLEQFKNTSLIHLKILCQFLKDEK
ncbi:hypothetical protein M9Y10_012865 [Tritrichomonas musculus]|uniref:Protein kinase domain-containing protein n=1 Tax=Tritrichomonas musculus TaxID=1915356 RepID=A0ABR2IEN8_9EUKA